MLEDSEETELEIDESINEAEQTEMTEAEIGGEGLVKHRSSLYKCKGNPQSAQRKLRGAKKGEKKRS